MGSVIAFRPKQEAAGSNTGNFVRDDDFRESEVVVLSERRRDRSVAALGSRTVREAAETATSGARLDVMNYLHWKDVLATLNIGRRFDASLSSLVKTYTDYQLVQVANEITQQTVTTRPKFCFAVSQEILRRGLFN